MPPISAPDDSLRIHLFRRRRPASTDDLSREALALFESVGAMHPSLKRWFTRDAAFRTVRCATAADCARLLHSSEIDWPSGFPPSGEPTHRRTFFVECKGTTSANVTLTFALEDVAANGWLGLRVNVALGAFVRGAALPTPAFAKDIFTAAIRAFAPDWGFVGTAQTPDRRWEQASEPEAGWLTYLSRAANAAPFRYEQRMWGPVPEPLMPSPAEAMPLDGLGWVVSACPDIPTDGDTEHLAALRSVRRALRPRVRADDTDAEPVAPAPTPAVKVIPWDVGSGAPSDRPSLWAGYPGAPHPAPPAPFPSVPVGLRNVTDLQGTQVGFGDPAAPPHPLAPVAPAGAGAEDEWAHVPIGMRGVTDLYGTQAVFDSGERSVHPFKPAEPGAPLPGADGPPTVDPLAGVPIGLRGVTSLTGTTAPNYDPERPVLPYPSPSPEARRPVTVPPAPPPPPDPRATAPRVPSYLTDMHGNRMSPPVLSPQPAVPSAPSPAPMSNVPLALRDVTDLTGTTNVTDAARRAAMPFPQSGPQSQREVPAPPPPAPPAPRLPDLTVEQYASFCVDLQVYPAHRAEVHARYCVADEVARQALDRVWGDRLARDPALRQRWQELCVQYRARLQSGT